MTWGPWPQTADTRVADYPQVKNSVVNLGIQVLSGKNFSSTDWRELERQIQDAVIFFEPRILPDSIKITAIAPTDMLGHNNLLQFEVRGELWSIPLPVELLIRTQLDLETGYVKLVDQLTTGAS